MAKRNDIIIELSQESLRGFERKILRLYVNVAQDRTLKKNKIKPIKLYIKNKKNNKMYTICPNPIGLINTRRKIHYTTQSDHRKRVFHVMAHWLIRSK